MPTCRSHSGIEVLLLQGQADCPVCKLAAECSILSSNNEKLERELSQTKERLERAEANISAWSGTINQLEQENTTLTEEVKVAKATYKKYEETMLDCRQAFTSISNSCIGINSLATEGIRAMCDAAIERIDKTIAPPEKILPSGTTGEPSIIL